MNKFAQTLDKRFKFTERGSSIKVEIIAGITTFLAMAYILAVNPGTILGFDKAGTPLFTSIFFATAISACIGTLLTALLANLPFAQAPGMGLNALFAGVMGGWTAGVGYTFGGTIAIVLISGFVFFLLTAFGLREKIYTGIPAGVRCAIPVGIGLFIAFIGLKGAGIILAIETGAGGVAAGNWLPQLVDFSLIWKGGAAAQAVYPALVALIGFIIIAVLVKAKVKGSVLIGILASTIIGIPLGVTKIGNITQGWNVIENFGNFFSFDVEKGGAFFAFDFADAFRPGVLFTTIMLIVTFCMVDMFDTIGTLVGCATKANLMNEDGTVRNGREAMVADSISTMAGAVLGTSNVTTFVESGAGVAEGGRTGLTGLVVAGLFFLSIFISPVFAVIPAAATAPALMYVGVLMMSTVTKIDFTDVKVAIPAFLAIFIMPLGYSITDGIGLGLISYTIIAMLCYAVDIIKYASLKNKIAADGSAVEKPVWPISIVTGLITALFLVLYFVPLQF